MADQNARQDENRFPALIAHTGTAGTAETVRVVADSAGNLGVNIVSGEIVASLGTVNKLESGTINLANIQEQPYAMIVDDSNSGTTILGEATTGAAGTSSVWRIKRIVDTGGAGTETVITWADSNGSFDNIWTARGTMSFS